MHVKMLTQNTLKNTTQVQLGKWLKNNTYKKHIRVLGTLKFQA